MPDLIAFGGQSMLLFAAKKPGFLPYNPGISFYYSAIWSDLSAFYNNSCRSISTQNYPHLK